MRRFAILAAALAAAPLSAQAAHYHWPVLRVIDGDTLAVDASADMPPELAELRVRLRGYDAAELGARAGCERERRAAEEIKAFVELWLGQAERVTIRDPEWGAWGGRVVADIALHGGTTSLGMWLFVFRHVRSWGADQAIPHWCDESAAARELRDSLKNAPPGGR